MTPLVSFFIIIIIVGFVTAGLKIQFDRFFAIILLISLMSFPVFQAINIFLWIIFFGAIYVLWQNREKIKNIPPKNKNKFLTVVPLLALIGASLGSFVFFNISSKFLLITISIIALLYGLRLIFIHFKPEELNHDSAKLTYQKICGLFGPVVSGFFTGLSGTSLKPLKLPFAIKIGHMNMSQVYIGNTITALYSSLFAIIIHSLYVVKNISMTINDFLLGISLWFGIHIVFKITEKFFKNEWRKIFQIIILLII